MAFGLGRNICALAHILQTDNRPEIEIMDGRKTIV